MLGFVGLFITCAFGYLWFLSFLVLVGANWVLLGIIWMLFGYSLLFCGLLVSSLVCYVLFVIWLVAFCFVGVLCLVLVWC